MSLMYNGADIILKSQNIFENIFNRETFLSMKSILRGCLSVGPREISLKKTFDRIGIAMTPCLLQ